MGLASKANHIYTVPVLKALNKTWQSFSNLRIACYHFPSSDLLLNILVTDINPKDEELSLDDIKKLSNPDIESDILVIKTIWDKPFTIDLLEYCVNKIANISINIDEKTKENLISEFMSITKSDHDPIVKNSLLHILFYPILKNISKKYNILRVLDIYFMHYLGFLDHQILYHRSYFETLSDIMNNIGTGLIDLFSEKVFVYLINQFDSICILGNHVLTIYHHQIMLANTKVKEDAYLEKTFKLEKTFSSLFSNTVITIKDLMSIFNWKRDKAARILSRLTNLELFIEKKVGKDKVFINNVIIKTFAEVKKSDEVKELIEKNIKSS